MKLAQLTDRTAVLFIGIAVGAAISQAFANGGSVLASPQAVAATAAPLPPIAPVPRNCPKTLAITPELNAAIRRGETIDVGVFGDSFGDGLWAAVHQRLRSNDRFVDHRFAKNSTGFTRYRSLNLLDDIRAKLDRQPVDIAIISFGANDTQGLWENGRGVAYMSDPWKGRTSEKIDAVIELMRERGISVVWVGLPKMREPNFEAEIAQMNAFNAHLMCSLNVPFIDTVPASVDADGNYTSHITRSGSNEPMRFRAGDGVHMTMQGYGVLIEDLLDEIVALAPEPVAAPAAGAASPAAGGPRRAAGGAGPAR